MRSNVVSRSDGEFSVERVQRHSDHSLKARFTISASYQRHLRIWDLESYETTNLETQNYAESAWKNRLNITWRDRKTAKQIREKTKVRDMTKTMSKLKWDWAGHVARRTDNRWTSRITFWKPRETQRNRGRPRKRWRDDLDSFLKHWHRVAQNVAQRRSVGKAYVQRRTFIALNWKWTDS